MMQNIVVIARGSSQGPERPVPVQRGAQCKQSGLETAPFLLLVVFLFGLLCRLHESQLCLSLPH